MSTTSALYRMWEELRGPQAPTGQWLHDLVARIAREEGGTVTAFEETLKVMVAEFDQPLIYMLGGPFESSSEIVKTAGSWEIRTRVYLKLPHYEVRTIDAGKLLDLARGGDSRAVEEAIRTMIVDEHFRPLEKRIRSAANGALEAWTTAFERSE